MDGRANQGLDFLVIDLKESKNRTFCFPWSKKATDGFFTIWSNIKEGY